MFLRFLFFCAFLAITGCFSSEDGTQVAGSIVTTNTSPKSARVYLYDRENPYAALDSTQLDAQGRFLFKDVPSVSLVVRVDSSGMRGALLDIGQTDHSLSLPALEMKDYHRVSYVLPGEIKGVKAPFGLTASSHGDTLFAMVAEGSVQQKFQVQIGDSTPVVVELRYDSVSSSVRLVQQSLGLTALSTVQGTLTGKISGVQVFLASPGAASFRVATTDAQGTYSFAAVPEGKSALFVVDTASGTRSGEYWIQLTGSSSVQIPAFDLKPVVSLRFVVPGAANGSESTLVRPLILDSSAFVYPFALDTLPKTLRFTRSGQASSVTLRFDGSKIQIEDPKSVGVQLDLGGTMTDTRDNRVYKVVRIDGKNWLAENLKFDINQPSITSCPNGVAANCQSQGYLYAATGVIALTGPQFTICPAGFTIPTKTQLEQLIKSAGGQAMASLVLRAKSGWATPGLDLFGFGLQPTGSADAGVTSGYGTEATLWTMTSSTPDTTIYTGLALDSTFTMPIVNRGKQLSLRCISE